MTEVVLRVDVGSVKVNEFRIYFLAIIANESVLLIALVEFKVLLK
jgi:hypothetical protein